MKKKSWFTLIELLIVIVIVGILSTLLFRTLWDMINANSKIQQEKTMTQELITIQTSINNISEHYPIIDKSKYEGLEDWFTETLYLQNKSWDKISLYGVWDCINSWCYLAIKINSDPEIKITNPTKTTISWIKFKILPVKYYTGSIYDLDINNINAEWFRIFWNLSYRIKNNNNLKSSYTLQHFIHLQQ